MSGDGEGGTDNPAFSHDEEAPLKGEEGTNEAPSPDKDKSGFVSQHYVEPARTSPEPPHPVGETRIEVPKEGALEKTIASLNGTPKPKLNGVNGNGNNNDVSFLNSTVTSVASNGKTCCRGDVGLRKGA
jgi:hypothetical protein